MVQHFAASRAESIGMQFVDVKFAQAVDLETHAKAVGGDLGLDDAVGSGLDLVAAVRARIEERVVGHTV